MKSNIIIIAGPTASGKSGLAMQLAEQHGGAIINADSMQVYSAFPILTAQPDAAALAAAPHYLYGYVSAPAISTAASWREDAMQAIHEVHAKNLLPIVVGGTGLYLEALMHGISAIPDVPPEILEQAKLEYEQSGGATIRDKLIAAESSAKNLQASDTQRLVRAYSVLLATGKPLGYWQSAGLQTPPKDWRFQSILISPPREQLYAAIDARFAAMLERGALEEVRAIPPSPHPSQKALGVKELRDFLNGTLPREAAIEKARQLSRNYAKRQYTWFNNRFMKKEEAAGRRVVQIADINNKQFKF